MHDQHSHTNIKILFVDGQSKSEHDPLLVPGSASPADLCTLVSALHCTPDVPATEYDFFLDDTTPLSSQSIADSLTAIAGRRPGEQVVRLYYYPRQPVAINKEQVYPDWIRSIKCLGDGRVAVGVYDKTVRFGDGGSDKSHVSVKHVVNAFVQCDDDNLIGGCSDGSLLKIPINTNTGSLPLGTCSSAVLCLWKRQDGLVVAGGHDGTISVHNPYFNFTVPPPSLGTKKGRKRTPTDKSSLLQTQSVHQDGVSNILPSLDSSSSNNNNMNHKNSIVSVGLDRRICHVDLDTQTTTQCTVTPSAITAADLSPSHSSYILGHADGSLRLYSPAAAASHHLTIIKRSSSWISSIAVNPVKPHLFAVGDHAGRVRVCDVRQADGGAVWETLTSGGGKVLAVAFSPDGHRLYSGGEECILREYTL